MKDKGRLRSALAVLVLLALSCQLSTPADTSLSCSSEALSQIQQKGHYRDGLIRTGIFSTSTSEINILTDLVTVLTEHNIGDCYVNFHTPKPVFEAPSPGLWYSEDFLPDILNVRTKRRWRLTKKARVLLAAILVLKLCTPVVKRAISGVKQVLRGVSDPCGWVRTNCAGVRDQLETLGIASGVMAALLLLRSGDVEQNPGPGNNDNNTEATVDSGSNNENQIFLATDMKLREIDTWYSKEVTVKLKSNKEVEEFIKGILRGTEPAGPIPPGNIPEHLPHIDLCKFCYLAYKDMEEIDSNEIWLHSFKEWCTLLRAEHSDGYSGTLFWNKNTRQLVIAHKGTKSAKDWKTDLSIPLNKITPQVVTVSIFVQIVRDAALAVNKECRGTNVLPIQIYITGHSLGAYLAQVSTFTGKFLNITPVGSALIGDSDLFYPHTVVYDGPGARGILEKIMDMINENRHQLDISSPYHLDITVYLADPSMLNNTQIQIGKLLLFTYADNNSIELGHAIIDFMLVMHFLEEHQDQSFLEALKKRASKEKPQTLYEKCFDKMKRIFIKRSNLDDTKLKKKEHSIQSIESWSKIKGESYLKPYEKKAFTETDLSQTEDTIETYLKLIGVDDMKNKYEGVEKYLPHLCDPSKFTDKCKGETRKKLIPWLRYCISKYNIYLTDLSKHITTQGDLTRFVTEHISEPFFLKERSLDLKFSKAFYNSHMSTGNSLSIMQTNIKPDFFYKYVKAFYNEKKKRVFFLPLRNTQLIKDMMGTLQTIEQNAIIILYVKKGDSVFDIQMIANTIKYKESSRVKILVLIGSHYNTTSLLEYVKPLHDIKYSDLENKQEILNWMEHKLVKFNIDLESLKKIELDVVLLKDFFELDTINIRDHSGDVLISDDIYMDQALLFPVFDKSVRDELEKEKAKIVNIQLSDEKNEKDILIYETKNKAFLISRGQNSKPKVQNMLKRMSAMSVYNEQDSKPVENTSTSETSNPVHNLLKLYIKHTNGIIIQGVAGHGKSSFLSRIRSNQYGEYFKNKCVFFLKLNDLCGQLNELDKEKNKQENEFILKFFQLCVNLPWFQLVENIVKHLLLHEKIVLMLDGYDEIYYKYRNVVNQLIEGAMKAGIQIWITSRREYVDELEKLCKTKAFLLENFSEETQKEYFVKYWQDVSKIEDDLFYKVKSEKLMKKILCLKKSGGVDFNEFCGIPLQAKMLATIALRNNFEIEEINEFGQIYEKFIETKYEIFFEQKALFELTNSICHGLSEKMRSNFDYVHELLSIFILKCDKDDLADNDSVQWHKKMCIKSLPSVNIKHDDNLKSAQQNFDETMMNIIRNIGIVEIQSNDENDQLFFNFLHRTYAEFFYAKYLVRNLCIAYSEKSRENEKISTFIKEVHDVLSDEKLKVIHTFINILLARANIFCKTENFSGIEFPSGASIDPQIASCISQVFFPNESDTEDIDESTDKNIQFGSEMAIQSRKIFMFLLENNYEHIFLFFIYALPDLVAGPFYWYFMKSDGTFLDEDSKKVNNYNQPPIDDTSDSGTCDSISQEAYIDGKKNAKYQYSLFHSAVTWNCQKVAAGLLSLLTANMESNLERKNLIKEKISTRLFDNSLRQSKTHSSSYGSCIHASALHIAAYYGHTGIAKLLVEMAGSDIITQISPNYRQNVFEFAIYGYKNGAAISTAASHTNTIHYLANKFNGQDIKELLAPKNYSCALRDASSFTSNDLVKVLVAHYLRIDFSQGEDTLLHCLFEFSKLEIIYSILADHKDIFESQIKIKNSKGELPLHVLFSERLRKSVQENPKPLFDMIEELDPTLLKEVTNDEQTILMCLSKRIRRENAQAMCEILKVKTINEAINCSDADGVTVLMHACRLTCISERIQLRVISALIEAGADVDKVDRFGNVAAMYAVVSHVHSSEQDEFIRTVFFKLINKNNTEMCKELLGKRNKYGWTFLHCLYYSVNFYIQFANDNIDELYPTYHKIDVLDHLEKIKMEIYESEDENLPYNSEYRQKLAQLIIEKTIAFGISEVLSLQDENGMTPLMFACWFEELNTVKLLLPHMSVEQVRDTKNKEDRTALMYAGTNIAQYIKNYIEGRITPNQCQFLLPVM